MKTTTNNINFPGTAKLFAFVVLISGLAFLSCMVTNAQVSNESENTSFINEVNDSYADVLKSSVELHGINMDQVWAARLDRALVAEADPRIEVETWMLDAEYANDAFEKTMEVEAWMLDTEYTIDTYEETLEIEDWMLDFDYFYSAESYEEALELENWMLDTQYFLDAVDTEDPVELEDWMLF